MAQLASGAQLPSRAEAERSILLVAAIAAEGACSASSISSRALTGGDINAINYFVANKYIEALKEMAHSPNQKMLILPFEASGILGSLAGIAEIARSSFDKSASPPPPPPRPTAPVIR